MSVAAFAGEDPSVVFKTLVTEGASKRNYVFVIPVCRELDLKKAAKAVGEKSIAMIRQAQLLPLTGYIHGGCSPVGMKKQFRPFLTQAQWNYPGCWSVPAEWGRRWSWHPMIWQNWYERSLQM